jgi:predicted site-specific integrase-resolvase
MKLSHYAKQQGISYRTALRWWRAGQIKGYQAPTGTIIVTEGQKPASTEKVAIYARVSSADHKENLERQAERLMQYCTVRGYQITQVVKEIGSSVNESRSKFLSLLKDTSITRIVVEQKDRATRFGFRYIETLLETQGRTIEVVNLAENDKEDLSSDLASIVASLYGRHKSQRLVPQIKACVEHVLKDEDK